MNADINWHAQQAINEADFTKAVRSIRERKERERAAALSGSSAPAKDRSGDQNPGPSIAWFKDPAGNFMSVLTGPE